MKEFAHGPRVGNLCYDINSGAVLEPDVKDLICIVIEASDLAVHIGNRCNGGYESFTWRTMPGPLGDFVCGHKPYSVFFRKSRHLILLH